MVMPRTREFESIDEEPMKPLLSLTSGATKSKVSLLNLNLGADPITFDLQKEYEKQEQRIEESKTVENGDVKRTIASPVKP